MKIFKYTLLSINVQCLGIYCVEKHDHSKFVFRNLGVDIIKSQNFLFYVCVDALCQSQQLFSHSRTVFYLPGLDQYYAVYTVPCSRTQHSDSGESQTSDPSIPSLTVYH